MRFHSALSLIALALPRPAWAAGSATAASDPQSDIVLAAQLGPYPVSIYQHEVKTSRPDPLAPSPELRRLMITVYRPFLDNFTCPLGDQSHIQYAPPVVLDALFEYFGLGPSTSNVSSIFAPVHLLNCSRPVPPSSPSGPLLLFSHGFGGNHYVYASIIQAAASSGYTVVAIDHTWEAAAVVFPDGYVAYASNITQIYNSNHQGQEFLQTVRIADSVSVLDAIERGEVPGLGQYSNSSSGGTNSSSYGSSSGCGPHSTSSASCSSSLRALMYGHSFGGSTAVNVAALDSRVLAASCIDGFFYGPVENGTVSKPLFLLASLPEIVTAAWSSFYPAVSGWKSWVRPNNTVHYGYTDLPLLVDLLDIRGSVLPMNITGTIDSGRLQQIVWRYTTQFFNYVLTGATPDLLEGPNAEFPDVEFVGHAEARKGS